MARISHGTLSPGVVSSFVVDTMTGVITITNRSQSGEIYVTVDGTTPVVGSVGYVVMGTRAIPAPQFNNPTTVKLISAGSPNYSIEGEST
jgi:hypothetical protein